MYLINSRALMQLADSVQGDPKTKARIRFAVQQWIDAASPSNFLALNPEALSKAVETQGRSLTTGMQHLLEDLRKGKVSQTDDSVFEVGRNIAVTEGSVVFENALFQLLEYNPEPQIHAGRCCSCRRAQQVLHPRSAARELGHPHTVEQGHRTFVMSWRNPDDSMKSLVGTTTSNRADRRARAVNRSPAPDAEHDVLLRWRNIAGTRWRYWPRAAKRGRSMTCSRRCSTSATPGSWTSLDESVVRCERCDRRRRPDRLHAQRPRLGTTFSFLRPNDLVWNYVVAK